jgi:acyl-CoA thioesterase I
MHKLIRATTLLVTCFWLSSAMGADNAGPIRLACVGDSITAGAGTTNRETQSYPAQLGRMLGEKWHVENFGVGGATLLKHGNKPYWSLAAFTNALASNPQAVIIMLGTNDTKPQNWKFKDEFVADYEDLIAKFTALPAKPRIFICRPPLVSGTNSFGIDEAGIRMEIPMIDLIVKDIGVKLIDNHVIFKGDAALLPDHVHPNEAGAALIAKTVFQAVMEAK